MVSSVGNSLGGTAAYQKSAQSSGTRDTAVRPRDTAPEQTQSAVPTREPAKSERNEKTNDNRRQESTQLEAKNDDQTLQTEQQRGSLLDIAV